MRVTQQDIARIANVSQATVSRVLAGDAKVDAESRERVLQAVENRNYRVDVRARSLRGAAATGLIGLVVNRPPGGLASDPFFARLTAEIVDYLAGRPYHLCLESVDADRQAAIYDEMLRTRRVDGLILVESEARDERIARLRRDRFPFVLLGNPLAGEDVHSVDNDNVLAAEKATAHLLDAGFLRVGFLGARRGVTVSDDRIAGYQRAVRGRQDEHLIWHADFGSDAARCAAREILSRDERPDALVVLDDFMAMGVILAARELGLRVPDDLGMVAFNDSTLCDLVEGGLSSVTLNIDAMVHAACDTLLAIVEGCPERAPLRTLIPCELRVRGSSIRGSTVPVAPSMEEAR